MSSNPEAERDEVAAALETNVADGLLAARTDSSGKKSFSVTEQGEARVVELVGGPDIAHVAEAFVKLLKENGTLLGPLNEVQERDFGAWNWVVAQRFAEITRWALEQSPAGKLGWSQMTYILENELGRLKPDAFDHRGRVVPHWPPA